MFLLGLGALGSVIFQGAAALLVYHTTRSLLSARDLEEHSQEVLSTLQLTSQRLDRLDLTSRLYFSEKDSDDLRSWFCSASWCAMPPISLSPSRKFQLQMLNWRQRSIS